MKTKNLVLAFSLFCGSLPLYGRPRPVFVPLLKCTPSDTSLFAFSLTDVKGCVVKPGGPICNFVQMETWVYDQEREEWKPSITSMGLTNQYTLDSDNGIFRYHWKDQQGLSHIDVDTQRSTSQIDIKLDVVGMDTHGEQTGYSCELGKNK